MDRRQKKVLLIHMIIWVFYSIVVKIHSSQYIEPFAWPLEQMYAVGAHIFVGFMASWAFASMNKAELAKANLLGTVFVGLIGFSTCFVGAMAFL